jgi:CheY-like chemotaxis protein
LTILVVDDEEALAKIAERTLRAAGYTVLTAGHADEALRTGAKHAGEIHLLLTDVIMPKMNGRDLARELSKTRPMLKVLYMSGYTDDALSLRGVLEEGTCLLGKPFTAAELTQKVREVLDGGIAEPAAERDGAAVADDEDREPPFDEDAIRSLSPEIRGSLQRALVAARYDEILEIVETIGKTHPGVAAGLRRMANDFDYDGMQGLLGQGNDGPHNR